MSVSLGEAFGFTISNDTKKADIGSGVDTRMEIGSVAATAAPYHSYKYYESGRTAPSNAGWHLRGDFEWGMYVVIEYIGCRAPRVTLPSYGTQVIPGPREICFTVIEGECGEPPIDSTVKAVLKYNAPRR